MYRKLTAFMTTLLVFTLLVAACSKSGGGATPTSTAKAFYDAAKAQDVQTLKNLMSKKSLEVMEEFAKLGGKSLDETLKAPSKMPPAFEARNEKISGDTATLEVKAQGDKWDTLYFVKEGGQWKIAFDQAMEKSMKDMGPEIQMPNTAPSAPSQEKGEAEKTTPEDEHSTH